MSAAAAPIALSAQLSGRQLIEASAGTGKTWTIAGLVLRLVVEDGQRIDRILAVTFTKAATAELRERIRRRLQDLLDRLEGRTVAADDFADALLARLPDHDLVRARLTAALRGFDDCAIYTTHAFCQRVLADRAFSTATPFTRDFITDRRDVLRAVLADFWRGHLAALGALPHAPALLAWSQAGNRAGLDQLQDWVWRQLERPIPESIVPSAAPDPAASYRDYVHARERCHDLWQREGVAVLAPVARHPDLRRSYAERYHAGWAQQLEAFLDGELLAKPSKNVSRFSAARLAAECHSQKPPAHDLFDYVDVLLEAHERLLAALAGAWRELRLQALAHARAELPRRLRAAGLQSYDDLLGDLFAALDGEQGAALAESLRARYPVALIDEFQDTDPRQWGILQRIYAPGAEPAPTMFLVGDPKQAIYSFRGADLYAYLEARASCAAQLDLDVNRRSVAPLVAALNRLFGARADPFRQAAIAYRPVLARPDPRPPLVEHAAADAAPLRLVCAGAGLGNKDEAEAWCSEQVAAEIQRLLAVAADGQLRLDEPPRPLRAGDIAVLVFTHAQATRVRDALARRGIACAEHSDALVFATPEAEQLERLLLAVANPQDEGRIRAALADALLGLSAVELAALARDEAGWDAVLDAFERHHAAWRDVGLMHMLRSLLLEHGVLARLAGCADGERRITNLLHLAELLHGQDALAQGIDAQLGWLAARRGADVGGGEEAQLRLESDAALVQLLTIHKSKGLEWPVTFLPFLWTSTTRSDDIVAYHDPAPPHRLRVDAGSADLAQAQARAAQEALAERLRLAYVALTRARHRCYLHCGALPGIAESPLGWLLHGLPDSGPADAATLRAQLDALAADSGGCIAVVDPAAAPAAVAAVPAAPLATLVARRLQRPLPAGQVVTSYSALLLAAESAAPPVAIGELPDHDQQTREAAGTPIPPAPPAGSRYAFPRGAQAGICLHGILERLDFGAQPESWSEALAGGLRRAGYPRDWLPALADWLREALAAPLPGAEGLALARLPRAATLRELEFHLPLGGVDPETIATLAMSHGLPVSPLYGPRLRGYLKGFIDLVFCHAGRWYVADWKSNHLGASAADYGPAPLAQAMAENDYPLQYLLYLLALHRFLHWRLPDYDYDRHCGGALYLFLRGLHPDAPGAGVVAARPPRALIDALDALLAGTGAPA